MSNWTGSWSFMNRFFIKNTAQILNTLFFLMLFDRFFSVHVQNGSYSMVDVLYMYTMAHTLSLSSVYTVCKDVFKDTKDLECISKKIILAVFHISLFSIFHVEVFKLHQLRTLRRKYFSCFRLLALSFLCDFRFF